MKHQQTLCVIALLGVISACAAHIGGGQIALQNNPHMYCGRNLARTLALLCYDDNAEKRSETGIFFNTILSPVDMDQDVGWPWIASHKARALVLKSRGKRYTGVADECCDKPCTITELLQYC